MPNETITYSRAELYEQVWTEPVRTVAKRYGVSDVAFAKICRKLAVPLPGRGYWARKAAGQTPRRPPLAKAPEGVEEEMKVTHWRDDRHPPPPLPAEVQERVVHEKEPQAAIVVAATLEQPHKLVTSASRLLGRAKANEDSVLELSLVSGYTRAVWKDGKRQRVEECLNDVVSRLYIIADVVRHDHVRSGRTRGGGFARRAMTGQPSRAMVLRAVSRDWYSCQTKTWKVPMPTEEELKAELERLKAENAALKARGSKGISMKVSEKGAVSVYGLGRFPVTLYQEQWLKLLEMADDIRAFVKEHEGQLKKKE